MTTTNQRPWFIREGRILLIGVRGKVYVYDPLIGTMYDLWNY